jgi:hypothetical protein
VLGWTQGIGVGGENITVSQNTVQFNYRGIGVGPGTAKENVITGNTTGIVAYQRVGKAKGNSILGNQTGIDASGGGIFENNNIFGNGCGLYIAQNPPLPVIATNDYWGASTGPGNLPANDVCGPQGSAAVITPFATQPINVTLSIVP